MRIDFSIKNYKFSLLILGFCASFTTQSQAISSECLADLRRCLALPAGESRLKLSGTCRPLEQDVLFWIQAKKGAKGLTFEEITGFITSHSQWPQLHILQMRAERLLTERTPVRIVIDFFQKRSPLKFEGHFFYARALLRNKEIKKAQDVIRKTWHTVAMTLEEEEQFLQTFQTLITSHDHYLRAEQMLWQKRALLPHHIYNAPRHLQKTLRACNALISYYNKALSAYQALPSNIKAQEIVRWCHMHWLIQAKNNDEAIQAFEKGPWSRAHASAWNRARSYLAREMLEAGDAQKAYHLLQQKIEPLDLSTSANLQWFSGWLALRFLNKLSQAQKHFEVFYRTVKKPLSVSRAAYWLGRLHEAHHDKKKASTYYRQASRFKITFYGQLASLKLNETPFPTFFKTHNIPSADRKSFEKLPCVQALRFLSQENKEGAGAIYQFLEALALQVKTKNQKFLTTELADTLHNHAVVEIVRRVQDWDEPIFEGAYPILKYPKNVPSVEHALILGIIHRETRFNPTMVGPALERGLMQIMPKTAQEVASKLNIVHDPDQLFEPEYNMRLGTTYLSSLLERFQYNYLLTVTAYNGGQGNVEKWINIFGHPENCDIHGAVDWIEKIPYNETRDYVMRVLENTTVYRARMRQKDRHLLHDIENLPKGVLKRR